MAHSIPTQTPSDDELFTSNEKGHQPSSPTPTPSSIAASPNLSERKLLRKLDLYLVPGVSILYLLSFLDRSNVANARLEGLETDLNLNPDGSDYLNGLTLFFVGYILLEVLWNVILKRVGPRVWLPLITLVWGVVATLQGCVVDNGVADGAAGFLAVRFFLGLTEGGLFPGVVFYLSMVSASEMTCSLSLLCVADSGRAVANGSVFVQWYKREERQYRVALFFSAASLAGAFGGILAWGIGHMGGVAGLSGWRYDRSTCKLVRSFKS